MSLRDSVINKVTDCSVLAGDIFCLSQSQSCSHVAGSAVHVTCVFSLPDLFHVCSQDLQGSLSPSLSDLIVIHFEGILSFSYPVETNTKNLFPSVTFPSILKL